MPNWLMTLLNFTLSGSSVIGYVICLAIGFGGGWYFTSDHYEAKIESIRSELLAQSKKEIDDYATRLAQTADALVVANNRIASLSNSNSNLARRLLDANNRESERAKTYSESTLRTRYAECRRLLSEGNDLLNEGSDLAQRTATKHDALANLVK